MVNHHTNTRRLITNFRVQRGEDIEQVYVIDDIPIPVREEEFFDNDESPDKRTRRVDAAVLTWTTIKRYIHHNYLANWIPRMTKYFNKYTTLSDDIWDPPVLKDAPLVL